MLCRSVAMRMRAPRPFGFCANILAVVLNVADEIRCWMLRVFIGLGIPFIGIVLMLPIINTVTLTVFNIPFLYVWMFSWFILASGCLGICWFAFDRHRPEH